MHLTVLPVLETLFLLLGCLIQSQYEGFYTILCHLLVCLGVIYWRPAHFGKGSGSVGVVRWGSLKEQREGKLWSVDIV